MNKAVWPVLAIVVLVVIGGGVYLAQHKSSNNTQASQSTSASGTTNSSASNSSNSSSSNQQNAVATDKVAIANFAFSPADITVKKGTTVTWTNNDSTTHTVTESDSKTGPNSGNLTPGSNYSFTFNTAGTYPYHCTFHADMIGTVTVTE